ncbi:hypothetical protein [Pseudomonas sp. dw_358]|uniref:hypothetical protein n=1 Tax=Pseudomonas sp. dw_358 TaxID=2720083 RepID=UPI001BD547DE|nr:hypothetical protein [Pseudomonas sp. dw_358]
MRWMFLLLLILNVFYYVWHQQEAPMQAKEIMSLSPYKSGQQDIQLLSESKKAAAASQDCLYLGGYPTAQPLAVLVQRLANDKIPAVQRQLRPEQGGGYWLRLGVPGEALPDEGVVQRLSRDINDLKHQIMPCEGIASGE